MTELVNNNYFYHFHLKTKSPIFQKEWVTNLENAESELFSMLFLQDSLRKVDECRSLRVPPKPPPGGTRSVGR